MKTVRSHTQERLRRPRNFIQGVIARAGLGHLRVQLQQIHPINICSTRPKAHLDAGRIANHVANAPTLQQAEQPQPILPSFVAGANLRRVGHLQLA